jgi:hypothetical protein
MNMCVAELFTDVPLGFMPMAADADVFDFVQFPTFVVMKYLGLTPFDRNGVLGGVSVPRCFLRLGGGVIGGVSLLLGLFSPSLCHRFSLSLFIFHGHVPASIPTPALRLSSRLMRPRALMAMMRLMR